MRRGEREYPATVLALHDGDTLTLRLEIDLGVEYTHPARLIGLNCPELPTPLGIAALAFTRQWLIDHRSQYWFVLKGDGKDKYGRLLGKLRADDGEVLNDALLASGNAVVMKD